MGIRINVIAAGIALAAQPVLAEIQPQAVDLGAFKFTPTVTLSQSYDDNLFRQPNREKSSAITNITPQLQFVAQKDASTFALTYTGDYALYASSSDDNYQDHGFSADAYLDVDSRNDITLAASFEQKHDARGTGSSEGGAALSRKAPDEFDLTGVSGEWDFGSEGAAFGATLSAAYADISYTNNRLETQFRDRDEGTFAARFYGRLQPKTRFFLEATTSNIEYDVLPISGAGLDSDQNTYSVGLEWEATGKTTGSIKLGRTNKDFDSAARKNADLSTWEAEIIWSPRTYSNVFLSSNRAPRETNGTGSFIDSRTHQVLWLHDWSSLVHSSASFALGNDEYDNSPRSDDRTDYSFGINYDFDRWMNVGFSYNYSDLDSNDATFDYTKRVVVLSLNVSL